MEMTGDGIRPRLVVVPGDFSGVGPELTARLLADPQVRTRADLLVTATRAELTAAAPGVVIAADEESGTGHGSLRLLGSSAEGLQIRVGTVDRAAGERALADLDTALQLCTDGQADGVLFLPLNKAALSLAGMTEEDELRWFANRLGHRGFTSELNVIEQLVTGRVTSHLPLSEVAAGIRTDRVLKAILLLQQMLVDTRTPTPRIAVCALNPHGGEGGKFGREEIDEIGPAVERAADRGVDVTGPYPCDTLFRRAMNGGFDGVLTMYHDQGQIAMKLLGFDQGVTVHGGLPIPIATPAHGTAHDIVGTGRVGLGPSLHAFGVVAGLAASRLRPAGR